VPSSTEDSGTAITAACALSMAQENISAGITWAGAVQTTICVQVACGLFVASRSVLTDNIKLLMLEYFKSQHSHLLS